MTDERREILRGTARSIFNQFNELGKQWAVAIGHLDNEDLVVFIDEIQSAVAEVPTLTLIVPMLEAFKRTHCGTVTTPRPTDN